MFTRVVEKEFCKNVGIPPDEGRKKAILVAEIRINEIGAVLEGGKPEAFVWLGVDNAIGCTAAVPHQSRPDKRQMPHFRDDGLRAENHFVRQLFLFR
jgi:hypothetical protein